MTQGLFANIARMEGTQLKEAHAQPGIFFAAFHHALRSSSVRIYRISLIVFCTAIHPTSMQKEQFFPNLSQ
jgi:hypothetical protein